MLAEKWKKWVKARSGKVSDHCPRCGSDRRLPSSSGDSVAVGEFPVPSFTPIWECWECGYQWGQQDELIQRLRAQDQYSYQFRKACMLRIVTEIVRRWEEKELPIVLELHPAGGQGYCIAFYRQKEDGQERQQLGSLRSRNLYVRSKGELKDRLPYLELMFESGHPMDVVDLVAEHMGIAIQVGNRHFDRRSFIFHIMAALLEDRIDQQPMIDIGCGWYDSAGYEGSCVRKEIRELQKTHAIETWSTDDWVYDMKKASEFWIVGVGREAFRQPVAVLHTSGQVYWLDEPGGSWDAFEEFVKKESRLVEVLKKFSNEFDSRIRLEVS
jgi:hypothetical protein